MGQGQGYTNRDDFQVLEFYCSICTVKSSSNGTGREYTFQNQTSNSLSISAPDVLRTNTDSSINLTILILLALNARNSYEWFF